MVGSLLTTVGLLIDLIGVLMVARYGLPADFDPKGRSFLLLESTDQDAIRRATKYRARSQGGIGLIAIGLVFQIIGVWISK